MSARSRFRATNDAKLIPTRPALSCPGTLMDYTTTATYTPRKRLH